MIVDETGVVAGIVSKAEAGEDVQQVDGILSPGFINCHCHLELSHMRNLIPQKTGLIQFVFTVVTQRQFNEEEIVAAIHRAEQEMIENGIVAVGDICNTSYTAAQKLKHNLRYYNFVEVSGWMPDVAQTRLTNALQVLASLQQSNNKHSSFNENAAALVPHAPYSVSNQLWHLLEPYF